MTRFSIATRSVLLIALAFGLAACSGSKPDADVAMPQTDSREVRYLRLDNAMQVVLISDPSADKAAAALDVRVGSRQDPRDRQGLAHFLEHMLFLGTEKYPEPGEYQAFVSAHGGSHNAYTSFEHTNYFFDVAADHLEEGLDRFAQFFIAPLFNPEFVQREVNAVDSEYQARIHNDYRRALDVFKELINPEHPFSKFTVGNLSTLLGGRGEASLRQALLDFYRDYYSADRMGLVVIGREDLDSLQAMVTERFDRVPRGKVVTEDIEEPLRKDQGSLRYVLQPRKELRELSVNFALPDVRAHYHKKPLHYIGHMLGHEGEGSLLQWLKQRGWAEGLRAGTSIEYDGGTLFSISVELTAAGMAQVDAVTDAVFEAIALLREEGVERWRYQELSDIGDLQFHYRTRPNEVREASSLAHNLHYYSPDDVIRGDYLLDDFDPSLIGALLGDMTVDKAIIGITRPDVDGERQSQLYGVPYRLDPVPETLAEHWRGRSGLPGLTLPEANPFIPERLAVKEAPASSTPQRIVDTDRMAVWHMRDERFAIPKGNLNLLVRSPDVSSTAQRRAASEVWVRMVRDELNAFAYPAQLAGLDYSIRAQWDGIALAIRGFDDKQAVLLESIANRLGSPQWDEARFQRVKTDYIRDLENSVHDEPYRYLARELSQTLRRYRWPLADRLAAARELTLAQVRAQNRQVMGATQLYLQAHGNYREADARELARIASDYLLGERMPSAQPEQIRRILRGSYGLRFDTEHSDAGLIWYLQAADPGHRGRVVMGVAGQMLGSEFFHRLRTEKQLGYVVTAGAYPLREVPGLYFMAQSPVADAGKLQTEFVSFLDNWLQTGITAADLDRHKQALRGKLLESPRNLGEAGDLFWQDLMNDYPRFDSREQLVAALDALDFESWQRELRSVLDSSARRALWLQIDGRWGAKNLGVQRLPGPDSVGQKRQYFLYEHPAIGIGL